MIYSSEQPQNGQNGWLHPNGTFIECRFDSHDTVACQHGYPSAYAMQRCGFILYLNGQWQARTDITKEQETYLSERSQKLQKAFTK